MIATDTAKIDRWTILQIEVGFPSPDKADQGKGV